MMSSKVTGSRFEILNTSQSLVTGLLNKRARANTTTTTKKEAKSQWEKEIRSRSPSDSSLIVCKFCFFVLLFTTQRSTSCVISLGSLSLLRDASFLLFRFLRQRYYRLTNQRNPPSTSHGKRFDAPEFLALPLDGRVPHSGEKEDREVFLKKDKN